MPNSKSSIKKSFAYNFFYQVLVIILPLITAPYIARALGADYVGIYSKTHAVANYFYLFTLLGVNNYGNRAIARVRDDRKKTSITFWEIYSFQAFMSIGIFLLYLTYCLCFEQENRLICILQSFYVLSGLFEINWFCFGIEKFKLTTIRNVVVRLILLVLVFIFVHEKSDLWLYTLILSIGYIVSCLAVWPFVKKHVDFVKPTWNGIKKHIKPNLMLFWPVIAISLYNIMDKILLGYFSSNEEVAFYSYAERIVTIPTTLILALDNVVMPRMSNIFAKKENEYAHRLMSNVMLFAMFMASAMTFGLAGISNVFAPWFFGKEFIQCGYYILLLSPTILFKGWAGALRTQFIIPTGRDKIYIISLTAGAFVNLVLDFSLIPLFDGVGAIIGTLAAELTVALIQFTLCRKDIPLKEYIRNGISFIIIGMAMLFCVEHVEKIGFTPLSTLIIQICIGATVYTVCSSIYMILTKQTVLINESLKVFRIKRRF